jgi:hypothetical protein
MSIDSSSIGSEPGPWTTNWALKPTSEKLRWMTRTQDSPGTATIGSASFLAYSIASDPSDGPRQRTFSDGCFLNSRSFSSLTLLLDKLFKTYSTLPLIFISSCHKTGKHFSISLFPNDFVNFFCIRLSRGMQVSDSNDRERERRTVLHIR